VTDAVRELIALVQEASNVFYAITQGIRPEAADDEEYPAKYVNRADRALAALDKPEVCRWEPDEWDGSHDTACGHKFQFVDGGPVENECAYCPYCGRKIEVAK